MSEASMQEAHDRLAGRVDDLIAHVARLEGDLQDISAAVTSSHDPNNAAAGEAQLSQQLYDSVEDWVLAYYMPTFIRPIGGEIRWCADWERHPEAVVRFEAMWQSWEVLRPEGGLGMSTWLINHLDPNTAMLLSRTGPFAQCSPQHHL